MWRIAYKLIPVVIGLTAVLVCSGALSGPRGGRGAPAAPSGDSIEIGSRAAATVLLNGAFPRTWLKRAGGDRRPGYLLWPLPGRRLGRGFGSNGGRHLAIDITAPVGTPVRVAAAGMVGYANDELRGYGNLLMVLHPGGLVTLYAHLDAFKVRSGQRLRRGQIVATSGNTGLSRGPHLHFALIESGTPRDPLPLMREVPGATTAARRKKSSQ